jgi:TPR repeat protein
MSYRYVPILLMLLAMVPVAAAKPSFETGKQAYLHGDYQRAYAVFAPLAAAGDADAQKMLGIMYDYGQGVKKDPKKSLDWYIKAAGQGQPAVQYQVGTKYFRGDGVKQDYAEAAKWWGKAADGGQVDAQFNLGLMYSRGLGVKQDDARAAELFRAAAKQGHANAQYSLGLMFTLGRGVEKDYQTALKWFRKAAEQGVARAQFNLGVFYEKGYGVKPDANMAAKWYERAAAQGLEEAETKLAALGTDSAAGKAGPGSTPAVASTAPDAASTAPAESASPHHPPKTAPVEIRRGDWVLQQPADSYTLQIGSVIRERDMIKFIKNHGIESDAAYIKVVINGVTRYNGLYGSYSSYEEATQAARQMTARLGGTKPWVRNIGILQKMLR